VALRKILRMDKNEKELRRISKPVTAFDRRLGMLIDDLLDTLHGTSDGAGLAAPQVGVLKRVAVIDFGDGVIELVNPEILETSGEAEYEEGCLSLPGRRGRTMRPTYAKVKAFDRMGKEFIIEGHDIMALAFVHEVGHLKGELFIDFVTGDLWEVEA
jgi:peptide deformylase